MTFRRFMAMMLILGILTTGAGAAFGEGNVQNGKIPVRVLILPKFEIGEMTGDTAGEAQYYYEQYLKGADSYTIPGNPESGKMYIRDGIAMCITGVGKVNAALSVAAVLGDSRFDFSNAYLLSTGCAGSAVETTVIGDVFVISAAIDFDLGHRADSREMEDPDAPTWFHDAEFDGIAVFRMNRELTERVYNLVKDLKMETTESARAYMQKGFGDAEWATRDPKVFRGTTMTSDTYWKGTYEHENALAAAEAYGCDDPFATTEMEDSAIAAAAQRAGLLDRLIILRGSINMDVLMPGETPERIWGEGSETKEDNNGRGEIFDTAMKNIFTAGKAIIDELTKDMPVGKAETGETEATDPTAETGKAAGTAPAETENAAAAAEDPGLTKTKGQLEYTVKMQGGNVFTEPRDVTVSVRIRNIGDTIMPDAVKLLTPDMKEVEEFGAPVLTAGESREWEGVWSVTQSQLKKGTVDFYVLYPTADEETGEMKTKAHVLRYPIVYQQKEEEKKEEKPAEPAMQTGKTTKGQVNMRKGPSKKEDRITKLKKGTKVTILETVTDAEGNEWYKVTVQGVGDGYVMKEFIKISD